MKSMSTFSHQIKVRGFHCDMFQHVNNARYLELLEETRWEWLNSMGPFSYFEEKQQSFVVVSITIHYRWPAVLNDVLNISVETKHIGNRSATVHQRVTRISDNKVIAEADVTFALIDNTTGKAVPIDAELVKLLEG
ncbi:MAG TPA: thioesterase family protein [Chitinophagales bacterium]|nr:thioesterase family protein [Chitinophagales bacterium]